MKTKSADRSPGDTRKAGLLCCDVGAGVNVLAVSSREERCLAADQGTMAAGMNSPGTRSVWPYTSSADEDCRSSLGAHLRPSITHGSLSTQLPSVKPARRAAFMDR